MGKQTKSTGTDGKSTRQAATMPYGQAVRTYLLRSRATAHTEGNAGSVQNRRCYQGPAFDFDRRHVASTSVAKVPSQQVATDLALANPRNVGEDARPSVSSEAKAVDLQSAQALPEVKIRQAAPDRHASKQVPSRRYGRYFVGVSAKEVAVAPVVANPSVSGDGSQQSSAQNSCRK